MSAAAGAEAASSRPLVALAWIVGAVASFSTLAVAGRELANFGFNTFEIMFWRSLLGLPPILALIAVSPRGFGQLRTARVGLHAGRHSIHFVGQNLWFFAVAIAPLAEVIALEFTSPVWIAILAALFLGERFTWTRAVAAVLGFLGVLAIVRIVDLAALARLWAPGGEEIVILRGFSAFGIGQLAALGAAIGFALTNLGTKMLTRTDSTLNIVFWMTLSQLAMAYLADLAVYGDGVKPPDAENWVVLVLIGVAGFAAHFCLTAAYRAADAGVVAPMEFARLPVVALLGAAFFSEPLQLAVLLGGLIIFFGNFLNIRAESRRGRR